MAKTTTKRAVSRNAASRSATSKTKPAPRSRAGAGLLKRIQSILVPIDFSDASKTSLRYAAQFAKATGAKITLVHVVEPLGAVAYSYLPLAMENDQLVRAAKEQLQKLAKREVPPRLLDRVLVRTGRPHVEITQAARTLKVNLIIMATHGRGGFALAVLGSTTERVVRHAACPVLTVPSGR